MSIRLMSEVWRTQLPTVEKMVLLVIADHANDEGTEAWPSQATIAAKASVSVRTVQRAVNSLVSAGFLRLEKHAGGSANCREDRRPHRYTILLNSLRGDSAPTRKVRGDSEGGDGATFTPDTGRLLRPKNLPLETPLEPPVEIIKADTQFDLFWKIYPLKVGKAAAQKAWVKASAETDPDLIISGALRYAQDPNRNPSFTAHPTTWLNAARWADDPLPPREMTIEEKRAQEALQAKLRAEQERLAADAWRAEIAEAEARKAPMPDYVRKLLRK